MFSGVVMDDSSVLPVPSHVVLNHLSTSSIRNVEGKGRNGVIAVGSTVRYREKVGLLFFLLVEELAHQLDSCLVSDDGAL